MGLNRNELRWIDEFPSKNCHIKEICFIFALPLRHLSIIIAAWLVPDASQFRCCFCPPSIHLPHSPIYLMDHHLGIGEGKVRLTEKKCQTLFAGLTDIKIGTGIVKKKKSTRCSLFLLCANICSFVWLPVLCRRTDWLRMTSICYKTISDLFRPKRFTYISLFADRCV